MPRPLPNPSAKRSRAGSKRRAAGWMLLTLGVLVAAVWAASGWWAVSYEWGDGYLGVLGGMVDRRTGYNAAYGWNASVHGQWWQWWLGWKVDNRPEHWGRDIAIGITQCGYSDYGGTASTMSWQLVLLWPLPLLLLTTGGLALWSGRRARRRALEGHCPTCGYNLAGLNRDAGGVCPECGTVRSGAERMNAGN